MDQPSSLRKWFFRFLVVAVIGALWLWLWLPDFARILNWLGYWGRTPGGDLDTLKMAAHLLLPSSLREVIFAFVCFAVGVTGSVITGVNLHKIKKNRANPK